MEQQRKRIWLTTIIAVFGIIIGFMGELMPDTFKSKVEVWSTATVGISYLKIWIATTALLVLIFLWLLWKEARQNNQTEQSMSSGASKVVRQGKKSIYIEKNDGPINIK